MDRAGNEKLNVMGLQIPTDTQWRLQKPKVLRWQDAQ